MVHNPQFFKGLNLPSFYWMIIPIGNFRFHEKRFVCAKTESFHSHSESVFHKRKGNGTQSTFIHDWIFQKQKTYWININILPIVQCSAFAWHESETRFTRFQHWLPSQLNLLDEKVVIIVIYGSDSICIETATSLMHLVQSQAQM